MDKQRKKPIPPEVLIPAALALITGALFVWLAQQVVIEKKDLFDTLAFSFLHQWTSPQNTTIALVVTRGGSDVFLIAIYLLVLYYFVRNKLKQQTIQLVLIVSASFLLNYLLKHFYQRPRPLLVHLDYVISYSFPSGHTQATFTLCGILAYIIWKTKRPFTTKLIITIALLFHACLIGVSRIYLHVHYLSDVVAGACAALCWLATAAVFINLTKNVNNKN